VIICFDDCELDINHFELEREGRAVPVEPQVFDLLLLLIENRDRIVSKEELFDKVWKGRIVSDATLNSRMNAARKAIGDNGSDQRLIRTFPRRGYRFVGKILGDSSSAPVAQTNPALRQDIQFCTSPDGVRLAYASLGEGPILVKAANYLTHLEYDWESPLWHPTLERLATDRLLFRYDTRGSGLSDWDVDDITFEAFVDDLETVVDAAGLDRFALLGISQGSAVSVAYAVRHPERVSRMILYGGYALGRIMRGDSEETERAHALLTLMRQGWGDENSALLPAFSSTMIPDGSSDQIRALVDLQRHTATAENAVRIREACDKLDVVELLPQINVPTLVLHVRHDSVAPFEQGRLIASSIPKARFVSLEGNNHLLLPGEPAWERMLAEINLFLAE
jgi:DNA-binding winged helix-turn-helix (wHTH) protein